MTDKIIKRIEEIEHSDLISSAEEIEIENYEGEIYVSRYSSERGSAIEIEKLCNESDIDMKALEHACDINNWWYVL